MTNHAIMRKTLTKGVAVMELYIKSTDMSIKNQMLVKNNDNCDVFLIIGRWGQLNDTLSLYTLEGRCLVQVTQQTLSLFPTFQLTLNRQPAGKIKKYPGFLGLCAPRYVVKKLGWVISGDFQSQHYEVTCGSQLIMTVDKAITSSGECCLLSIEEAHHAPLCCVLAVIIEHYATDKDKKHAGTKQKSLREANC